MRQGNKWLTTWVTMATVKEEVDANHGYEEEHEGTFTHWKKTKNTTTLKNTTKKIHKQIKSKIPACS